MNVIKTPLASGWLSINDLEKLYGISKSVQAVLRMKKRQKGDKFPLPFQKIGKRILYKQELIESWILANKGN